MSGVKNVLMLLCKQINLCTGIDLTFDQMQLAKHNGHTENAMQNFWAVLNTLSHCAVNKINPELNFQHYGDIKSAKICFAYLGYGAIEFYGSSGNLHNSRALLIALGWLIATQNCFDTIVHDKLIKSLMGREFMNPNNNWTIDDDDKSSENAVSTHLSSHVHLLIHKCNRINNNLKEIAELIEEKIRLIARVHCASLNTNNLPHLNTSELYLIKKLFTQTKRNENNLQECENGFEEMQNIIELLHVYTKWKKRESIFFDWMETVLDDSTNDPVNLQTENNDELSTIVCIIRHLTKKNIHTIKLSDVDNASDKINNNLSKLPCVSRFIRVNKHNPDNYTDNNATKLLQQLNEINQKIDKKMDKFNCELKSIIKSIPNCLQV